MIGLIGKKAGMTQVFDSEGKLTPVTVIKVEPNVVVANRTVESDGYSAVVLGAVEMKSSHVSKPYAGQFKDDTTPKKHVMELRDFERECNVGDSFGVELLEEFSFVDVIGTSKGKGFQGVMKRHNFSGGRATHGSKFHRVGGSTGMAAYPSKVIKGTKMAGRMGGERKTIQNLEVVKVDAEKKVVLVKGAVPGTKDSVVLVRKAKKK
ncbi:50S ribosomal protein L3 [Oceanispirochaeta sp.]|jgi:large subunit ribosomal protein L3|uniref:50S ribosomal protein L3 n=1 Tax=Oceanispirochaeta sp. TaxID=2035350 RepID=UPI002607F35F|nr:50S ribosomal protein L3 [Oceanispirochaeta sp.]MDA3958458.1 50S ribosomal protein L3 [Oceanispirochaeta sp.]